MTLYKKSLHGALCFMLLFFLAQFSSQRSTVGQEKPKVNFFGTLIDQSSNKYEVENITISGLYKQIPFYKLPPTGKAINPETNITRFDLDEIYQITVHYKGNAPQLYTFKNRNYIEIEIALNDTKKTKSTYIIETNKKVYCDQATDVGLIEKELSFEAIDKLIINGHKERDTKKSLSEND